MDATNGRSSHVRSAAVDVPREIPLIWSVAVYWVDRDQSFSIFHGGQHSASPAKDNALGGAGTPYHSLGDEALSMEHRGTFYEADGGVYEEGFGGSTAVRAGEFNVVLRHWQ